jgi:hypothetical protein
LFCTFFPRHPPPAGPNWVRFARFTPGPSHALHDNYPCPYIPSCPGLASFRTNTPRPRGPALVPATSSPPNGFVSQTARSDVARRFAGGARRKVPTVPPEAPGPASPHFRLQTATASLPIYQTLAAHSPFHKFRILPTFFPKSWFDTRSFGVAETKWHAPTCWDMAFLPVRSDAVRRFLLCPYGHTTNGVPLGHAAPQGPGTVTRF